MLFSCWFLDLDRLHLCLLILGGVLFDLILGETPWIFLKVPHPVKVIGRVISFLDNKLNCQKFSFAAQRWNGFFIVLIMAESSAGVGLGWHMLSDVIPYFSWTEICLLGTLIAQKSLYQHVTAVLSNLENHQVLNSARQAVARICGRDTANLDKAGIIRATIESCAENLNDGVVAPVLWYMLFGPAGLLVYKTVNTLDSMIGYRNERYLAFGFVAARTDDLLNWVPARITGILIAVSAIFVSGAHPLDSLITMFREARKHRSPNSGWPEAAMAGALGIILAGPRYYLARRVNDQWIGLSCNGREVKVHDITRALNILIFTCVIYIFILELVCFFSKMVICSFT